MTAESITVAIMLGVAVLLALASSFGVLVMRDALQRLHFSTAVASLTAGLIVIAVWLDDPATEARIKATVVGLLLFVMNAVLTHATARAIYVRRVGCWPDAPADEHGEAKAGEAGPGG